MAERRTGSRAKRGGGTRRGSSGTARRSSQAKSKTARSAAAKRGGQARGRQQTARRRARKTASAATSPAEFSGKSAAELREALTRSLIRPLDLMMLTRDRIEDAVNDAVERGQMTARDAQDLIQRLVSRGRKQTNDVLSDLEQLLGRGPGGGATRARRQVEAATRGARSRAARATDPLLAQADRARRAAGIGPSFPITSYDDLTAAQVQSRLGDLTPAELRKVRDYERRHTNRKSVLSAIESKLA